jgi:hypothetical protein
MLSQSLAVIAEFSSQQLLALAIVAIGTGALVVISLAGIIFPAWASVSRTHLETTLKQRMVERGMSAEEIAAVLNSSSQPTQIANAPSPCEVVVEHDEEWSPALILKRDGQRYFVHFIGTEMSDNEWVETDRIRFPASSPQLCGSPWNWEFPTAANAWCSNTAKPAPVDAEI